MTSEIRNLPEVKLFSYPYYNTCVLPKHQFCKLLNIKPLDLREKEIWSTFPESTKTYLIYN
ncbi:hypothetical protein LCGC14_1161930 [marine sediment metagenome]|uniref:Uncharacterized protein n=1 Tax=marine sediment metagenome TaxID=412755 RepID=A0A0F9PY00_9ZZZZ